MSDARGATVLRTVTVTVAVLLPQRRHQQCNRSADRSQQRDHRRRAGLRSGRSGADEGVVFQHLDRCRGTLWDRGIVIGRYRRGTALRQLEDISVSHEAGVDGDLVEDDVRRLCGERGYGESQVVRVGRPCARNFVILPLKTPSK
jgi:hypothetical protein